MSTVRTTRPASDEGERLAKRVAQMVPCSRRQAEQYIEGGWVKVDGVVVEEPMHRVTQATIWLDPEATLMDLAPVTLVLNKPAGLRDPLKLLTHTNRDPHDTSGVRPLKRHLSKLAYPVPIEHGASGLVVFTQDWRTERKLTEDLHEMEHELLIEVRGEIGVDALIPMQRALKDERKALPHAKVSINSSTAQGSRLRLAVKGAHPGLAAYLCELAGLDLLALRRIRLGRVALSDLALGQWRYLAGGERF